jgi:hypothetical protein
LFNDLLIPFFYRRRIPRGKVPILEQTVEPIDLVYYGRLYAFKLIATGPDDSKIVSIFSAEDLESYSYWLISFDDCFKYQDEQRELKEQQELEKLQLDEERLQQAAATFARSRSNSAIDGIGLPTGLPPIAPGLKKTASSQQMLDKSQIIGERRPSMRLDHLEQHLAQEKVNDKKDSKDRTFDTITANAVSHNFFEDPGMIRVPSFKSKESVFANDDINLRNGSGEKVSKSRSKEKERSREIGIYNEPIIQLNDKNLDELLDFSPVSPPARNHPPLPPTAPAVPPPPPAAPGSPVAQNGDLQKSLRRSISNLNNNNNNNNNVSMYKMKKRDSELDMNEIRRIEFTLKKAVYPADRLSRRVKIWYCSGGFSLSTEEEIHQFVDALKNTDDPTLKAFSEEKFEHIHDWSNLLEVLRKYEQKVLTDEKETAESALSNKVRFIYEITTPTRPEIKVEFEFSEGFQLENLVRKISEAFGYSELSLLATLPPKLAELENPWCRGLVTVKEDLLFAEDLVLVSDERSFSYV